MEEIEKRIKDSYELPNNVLKVVPDPIVTVRTSAYQHGPYIKKCIEGVLMQKTTFLFEYIIGEDYSTDGTREIVFEYAKNYPDIIRVFTADYNVGSKANGRRCNNSARGKYIAICEGDDYWTDPYKLQKQVDFLEANPEYGLVHTDAKVFDKKKNELRKSDYDKIHSFNEDLGLLDRLFSCTYPIFTCTVVLRKEVLKYVDYNKNIYPAGDYFAWFSLAGHTKFKLIKESTAVRQLLTESATRSEQFEKVYRFWLKDFEMYLYFLKKYDYNNNNIIKTLYSKKIVKVLNLCIRFNKPLEYRQLYYNHIAKNYIPIGLKYKIYYYGSFLNSVFGLMTLIHKCLRHPTNR